ncbi:MAG: sigma-70 family RNA polymerase sigma factor [Tunicatimonas sp.]
MPDAKQTFVRQILPHQGLIRSLCVVYFSDEEDRKDAFQDVLLQLWKSYGTFRGESSLVTWVYKIALRTLMHRVHHQSRMPTCHYCPEHEFVNPADQESTEIIRFALNRLSPSDKALVLLYLEGYQYREIAELLSLSATNVSTRLNRIKQKLKVIITQEVSWN